MSLNPLAPVTDYPSMLNRIFWFTAASAGAAVWLLRVCVPAVDGALRPLDDAVAAGLGRELPTPGGTLLPALAVGIATRVFRLHARASDWLGIRECFDIDVILAEFASRAGPDPPDLDRAELRRARHDLMRRCFYAYVSGPNSAVDRVLTEQALDAWSWMWVGVEGAIVWTVAALGLIAGQAYPTGFRTLAAALGFAAVILPAVRRQCGRYGVAQVRAILADPARAAAVRAALQEAVAPAQAARRAA